MREWITGIEWVTGPENAPDEWKDLVATEMAEREKRKDIICEHIKKCNDPDQIKFWEWIIETIAENEKKLRERQKKEKEQGISCAFALIKELYGVIKRRDR